MNCRTVDGEAVARIEIKHSVFIATLKGIDGYDEGLEFVKRVASKYSDATHNCYAFLTRDGGQKFSDNGEPQGTAGLPMCEVLKKQGLSDVACVVTRYFGGIKLGAGGLVAAYSQAVAEAVGCAAIAEKTESVLRKMVVEYADLPVCNRLIESFGARREPPVFGAEVVLSFSYPKERDEEWKLKEKEFFCGREKSTVSEIKYLLYK